MIAALEMNERPPRIREVGDAETRHVAAAERVLPGAALGGYALADNVRFVVESGQGAHVVDESGNDYVDYVMGAGALILGHRHPAVEAAILDQVRKGTHFFSILNGPVIDLAEILVDAIPCAGKVTFTTTGSEATAYGLRFARAVTKRDKILKFEGAYHGNHDYSLIATTPKVVSNYPVGAFDSGGIPAPVGQSVLIAPYNDLDAVRSIVAEHWRDLAAIIVEPIQRVIPAEPAFLHGLRDLATEFGVMLVFDEVVTGFRFAWGGAQEYYGVVPDLAAYGKIVGGGIGLGALAASAEIMDYCAPSRKGRMDSAYVNGTMHGNPLGSAAGVATLEAIRADPSFYRSLNDYTGRLRRALSERLDRHGVPAIIFGQGSMWHVLFAGAAPRNHADVMRMNAARGRDFDTALIQQGIFVLPGVRRLVSGAHAQEEFDQTVDAFDRVCRRFG